MVSQADIDRHKWFHGIDFGGGLRSKGRSNPENWSLYGTMSFLEHIPMAGARVLDIGTMDGLIAYTAEQNGASVVATDLYDRQSMRLAKELLKSDVEYLPSTSIEDLLGIFGPSSFDIIVMGGLLYHLVSPLRAILIARNLVKTGGIVILETCATEEDKPVLNFNLGSPIVNEYTTYFIPSLEAVRQMMTFCCFDVLGSNKTRPGGDAANYVRGTVMSRAVEPSGAIATTSLMGAAQERASKSVDDRILDEFNFATLKNASASILLDQKFKTFSDDVEIDKKLFTTRFDLQPRTYAEAS